MEPGGRIPLQEGLIHLYTQCTNHPITSVTPQRAAYCIGDIFIPIWYKCVQCNISLSLYRSFLFYLALNICMEEDL
jgi:hypothetical protein